MSAMSRLVITLATFASLPLAAQAAGGISAAAAENRTGWFAGAGIGSLSLESTGMRSQDLGYVFVQGGWRFSRYLAVGVRAGASSETVLDLEEDFDIDFGFDLEPPEVDLKLAGVYGVFAQAYLPLADNWDLYALVGYSQATIEVGAEDVYGEVSASDSSGSFSYGVGVSWLVSPRMAFDLEYQPVVAEGSDWSASSLNLGFRFRF
jgi:opacity protein-like surface antigen